MVEEWQKEALFAICLGDKTKVAIRSGHGVGKSALLAWVILYWMYLRPQCKVGCTANSKDQLQDVLWSEIRLWWKRVQPEALRDKLEITSDRIVFSDAKDKNSDDPESFARARTAKKDNPEALAGLHSPNMLFVIDEGSGVEDIIFETAQGAMSSKGARTIMTGNPTRPTGYFHRAFHSKRDMWYTMKVSCADVPNLVTEEYRQELIDDYGEDSNVFKYRYLGEFPDSSEDAVIPLHLIEEAAKRNIQLIQKRIVWGLDVARFGDARTALCKRYPNGVREPVKWWRHKDNMQVAGLVMKEYEDTPDETKPATILVDATGLGSGPLDRLTELGMPVRGVNVGESASVSDKYMRRRDELAFRARDWFAERLCSIPEDPALIGELADIRYDITSSGKMVVESKSDMKRRGVKSPDLADAFFLTFDDMITARNTMWQMPSLPAEKGAGGLSPYV